MHSSYAHSAAGNQGWAPSWQILGWLALFTWPTTGWLGAMILALLLGPQHLAWTIAVIGVFCLAMGLLGYATLKRGNWLRDGSLSRCVPVMGEVRRAHKLLAKRRGNKYLARVWKGLSAETGTLNSYLYVKDGKVEWHVPGHPVIGDRSKAEQALRDALGVFERDFGVHHFEVAEAPGHRQQYIVRFFRDAPPDPLAETVSFSDLPSIPWADNPDYVVLGRTDDGEDLPFRVLGRHTLVLGASGSGKGSVIWSVVAGLSCRIAQGELHLYGIDLKGGVEFSQGRQLFRNIIDNEDDVIPFLEDMVRLLDERLNHMKAAGTRLHAASREEPGVFILIDEAASLTYAFDAKDQKRIASLIRQITTKGRAAAFSSLAAMQDPRKEAFAARDTFTQQVGLRFRTADDAKLALGLNAYNAGAHCETIPDQPGTGYVIDTEGTGEPIRFRAYFASDAFIRSLPSADIDPLGLGPIPVQREDDEDDE